MPGLAAAGAGVPAGDAAGATAGRGGTIAGRATPGAVAGDAGTGAGAAGFAAVAGDGEGATGAADGGAAGRTVFGRAAADFAASAAASFSASPWKCLRASSACSMSSELEWVFFSVTPMEGKKSIRTLALISSSRASSLIRIWFVSAMRLWFRAARPFDPSPACPPPSVSLPGPHRLRREFRSLG
jgi:hypothetical protein